MSLDDRCTGNERVANVAVTTAVSTLLALQVYTQLSPALTLARYGRDPVVQSYAQAERIERVTHSLETPAEHEGHAQNTLVLGAWGMTPKVLEYRVAQQRYNEAQQRLPWVVGSVNILVGLWGVYLCYLRDRREELGQNSPKSL